MSEKEKEIFEKLGSVIPNMSEDKKEYILGVADGIALMSEPKEKDTDKISESSSK